MNAKLKKNNFLHLECLFNVDVINIQKEDRVSGIATSISAGGVCVLTDKPLPPDTGLFLKFHFPNRHKSYNIEGKTVWTKQLPGDTMGKYENGIEFILVNRELKKALAGNNIVNLHLQV